MNKPLVISILLVAAMGISFLVPKPKYVSLDILSQMHIPAQLPGWRSIDVSKELNLQDDRYNFISNAFARLYRNVYGEELLLLVLDAGNFHNPKVCYTSSGYTVQELENAALLGENRDFKASALDMRRPQQGTFMFYWLCIDKKVKDWAGQKVTELWSAIINKKKAGLMVRIEIPAQGRTSKQAQALGMEFVQQLEAAMRPEERGYFFGE